HQVGPSTQTDRDCSFLGFDIDYSQVAHALPLHENDVFARWGSFIKGVQQCPSIIWQVNNPNNFDRIARIILRARANGKHSHDAKRDNNNANADAECRVWESHGFKIQAGLQGSRTSTRTRTRTRISRHWRDSVRK